MKVLVAYPVHRQMIFARSVESVMNLRWPDGAQVDVLTMIDGDRDLRWNNYCRKLNEAREVALRNGYDALMTVDSDIIVPADALQRLSAIKADVVYGLIILRFGTHQWNATEVMEPEGKIQLLTEDPEAARRAWGQVIDVVGHGHAICFIHRHVLERINFRTRQPHLRAPDWYWSFDCQELGFVQKMDLGCICGHIDTNPLRIYWPAADAASLYEVEEILPSAR